MTSLFLKLLYVHYKTIKSDKLNNFSTAHNNDLILSQKLHISKNAIFHNSNLKYLMTSSQGIQRRKRDGVIGHECRENGNWMEILHYCMIDQSGVQRDWCEHEFRNFWA